MSETGEWRKKLQALPPASQTDIDTLIGLFTEEEMQDIERGVDWALERATARVMKEVSKNPSEKTQYLLFVQVWG
jgi:hypothetical protein